MSQKPQAHPELNEQEYIIAAIAGTGLFLAIMAGMFAAFGIAPDGILGLSLTNYFWIGAVLMLVGLVMWLTMLQPWHNFDDLQTPYYTGHHDHHDDHADEDDSVHHLAEVDNDDAVLVDDLEIIEGIGTRIRELLVAAGIPTFAALAQAKVEDLQKILDDAGESLNKPDTWAKQAQYVVNGDLQGFEGYKRLIKGGAEDLTKIEGIGPKVRDALARAGIETFDELARADIARLQQILDENKLKLPKPGTWAKQAQFVADGDIAGLERYQATLKGGVENV